MVVLVLVAALAYALPALGLLIFLSPSVPWRGPARGLAGALVVLALVNWVTVVTSSTWDPTAWFVADNLAFAAMVGAGLFGLALAGTLSGTRLRPWVWAAVAGLVAVCWLVGLWGTFVAPGGGPGAVFTAGTLGALALVVASIATVGPLVGRLVGAARRWAWGALGILGALALATVVDETGGPHWPLSPGWLVFGATALYAVAARWVRAPEPEGPAEAWARRVGLSGREREVLRVLLRNPDRAAAAETLYISPVTVKNHLASMYRRTGLSDLPSLLAEARAHGWTETDQKG